MIDHPISAASKPSAPKSPAAPAQRNPDNSDDGLLDSLGKAIADPVKTGAEKEEPLGEGAAVNSPGNGRG